MKSAIEQLLDESTAIDELCPRKNVEPKQAVQRFLQVS